MAIANEYVVEFVLLIDRVSRRRAMCTHGPSIRFRALINIQDLCVETNQSPQVVLVSELL